MLSRIGSNEPDGWKAMFVAVSGSIVQAVAYGTSNSFPTFQFLMNEDSSLGNPTLNDISLASAISLGTYPLFGLVAGYITHHFGPRISCFISVLSTVAAMVVTSQAVFNVGGLIACYGLFMGASMGFMLSPAATASSTWFIKRKSLGMGVTFTGGGSGSLVIPNVAGALVAAGYSWRTSFLILAAFSSLSLVASFFVCLRPTEDNEQQEAEEKPEEVEEASDGHELDIHSDVLSWGKMMTKVFLTRNFIGLFFAYIFFAYGFYILLYIAVPYPLAMGKPPYESAAPITPGNASLVFVGLGVAQVICGPLLGFVASKSDDRIVCILGMGVLAVSSAFYALCRELWTHIIMLIIFAFGIQAFFATFGSMVGQRFYGPNLPATMSVAFSSGAISGFVGSITAAAITTSQNNDYTYNTVLMSINFILAGACIMFLVQDPPPHQDVAPKNEKEVSSSYGSNEPDNVEEEA